MTQCLARRNGRASAEIRMIVTDVPPDRHGDWLNWEAGRGNGRWLESGDGTEPVVATCCDRTWSSADNGNID
jgi:hypothetical protein